MSVTRNELSALSDAVTNLVSRTVSGVVAVKGAAYRSVSGVSIRPDVIAVTDPSLRRERDVPVYAADGTKGTGSILGREPRLHVAFLRVNGLSLQPLAGRDAASLQAGMLAAVVGMTTDAGPSVSLGVLGAVGGPRRTWRGGTLEQFIRLDVNVYPSQAGAAVVDSEGGLIGLATPGLLQYSAVAIPAATLNRLADELLERGRIRHGYLGVGMQPVMIPQALREKTGGAEETGLMVLSVEADSAAERAGVQLGDILLSLGGTPVNDIDELQNALRGENVGQKMEAVLLRGGERITLEITISERVKPGQ